VLAGFARQFNLSYLPSAGYSIRFDIAVALRGWFGPRRHRAERNPHAFIPPHPFDEDLTAPSSVTARYDEEALKQLNHFLRDLAQPGTDHDGSSPVLTFSGGLPRRRCQKPIQIISSYRSPPQRHASPPFVRGGALQPAYARPRDGLLHSGRSTRAVRYAGLRLQRGGVGFLPDIGIAFSSISIPGVSVTGAHDPRSAGPASSRTDARCTFPPMATR